MRTKDFVPFEIKVGNTYKVISAGKDCVSYSVGDILRLSCDDETTNPWFANLTRGRDRICCTLTNLEPYEEEKTSVQFKVGDRVKTVGGTNADNTFTGEISKVESDGKVRVERDDPATHAYRDWLCKKLPDGSYASASGVWDKVGKLVHETQAEKPKNKFKAGDIVENKNGRRVTVTGVPGMVSYDEAGFAAASEGFEHESGWGFQEEYERINSEPFKVIDYPSTYWSDGMNLMRYDSDKPQPEGGEKTMADSTFKVGDKLTLKDVTIHAGCGNLQTRIQYGSTAYIVVTNIDGDGEIDEWEGFKADGSRDGRPDDCCALDRLQNLKRYGSAKGGIMAQLTQLAKRTFDADTKALIEVGFLDQCLELTQAGKDFVLAQYVGDNKKALADEARKIIAENKKDEK